MKEDLEQIKVVAKWSYINALLFYFLGKYNSWRLRRKGIEITASTTSTKDKKP